MEIVQKRIGFFRNFGQSEYQLTGEILMPFSERMPLTGGYLVIEIRDLEDRPAGLLCRVMHIYPTGDLQETQGEEYLLDLMRMEFPVPAEVKNSRLRYRLSVRLLGQVSITEGKLEFTPAMRTIPHLGAHVGLPTQEAMRIIAEGKGGTDDKPGAIIGHLTIGDLAIDGSDRVRGRNYPVRFHMDALVGRRSAVFARAGMGKSNFTKVLLTRLYETDPGVGTLIFDPEGEYAFENASEPGLLDVPHLRDRVVVYTDRDELPEKYRPFIKGKLRIDFSELRGEDFVLCLPPEKRDMVFASRLRSLKDDQWKKLVDLLARDGFGVDFRKISQIIGRKSAGAEGSDFVVVNAMVNNVVPVLDRLHSSRSRLIANAVQSLRAGKIVIMDISFLGSTDAYLLGAWLLSMIFQNNQKAYTAPRRGKDGASLIPTLAILEEAQFYLGQQPTGEDSPYVRWFKEGRKFQLGSIVVTQQPGAIDTRLISQCDNFFVFHLLSGEDLRTLTTANVQYAGDVATSIGSEPIPGNCFLWSTRGFPFVITAKILHFGALVDEAEKKLKPLAKAGRPDTRAERQVKLPVKEIRPGTPDK